MLIETHLHSYPSFSLAFNYSCIYIKALRKKIHISTPDNTPHILNHAFGSKRIVAMIQKSGVNCSIPALSTQFHMEIKSKRKVQKKKIQINKGFKHRERKESIELSLAEQLLKGLVIRQQCDIPMRFLISLSSCDC